MKQIRILPVRALSDNYCYLVYREGSRRALVIDPSEATPISDSLAKSGNLNLEMILNTHHHHDHVGGNKELSEKTGAEVGCSITDLNRVPNASRGFRDGDNFEFDGIKIQVLEIPGHTRGQIAYYLPEACAVFVGDTLFAMGCGRVNEGSPGQLFSSLNRLVSLPSQTRIYVGHEYTDKNARFAKIVEPENLEIEKRLQSAKVALNSSDRVPPSTIEDELLVNPFLRTKSAAIRHTLHLEKASDLDVFTRLREMRNDF